MQAGVGCLRIRQQLIVNGTLATDRNKHIGRGLVVVVSWWRPKLMVPTVCSTLILRVRLGQMDVAPRFTSPLRMHVAMRFLLQTLLLFVFDLTFFVVDASATLSD